MSTAPALTRTPPSSAARALAAWRAWWFTEAPLADLAIARVLLVAVVLYLNGSLRFLSVALAPHFTWEPIPLVDALGLAQPDLAQIAWLRRATRWTLLAVAAGFCTNVALLLAFLLQLVQEGLLNCFGKVTHSTIPLMHAMLFLALAPCGRVLSVDALLRRGWHAWRGSTAPAPTTSRFARWPFELLFVELAFYYFDAGLSKLSASGLGWADGYTLQYFLLKLGGPFAYQIASHLWLCTLLSAGALAFEIGFPLAIVLRRLRPFFLAAGVCFHLGNHLLLDLIFWPVIAVYPLVVPWSQVAGWFRRWATGMGIGMSRAKTQRRQGGGRI